jgi:hypothetical protein
VGALRARLARLSRGEQNPRDARAGRRLLWALILIGFALRIARLHEYGFSPDEAQLIYFGSADTLERVWQLVVSRSPHPPANFAMLHYLLEVSRNPLWLRLPAVLAGTFLIWMAHRFGRALLGPAAGLAMAALVTFSPATIELSRVCRNYTPGFAFMLLSLHLMLRYLQTGRWRPLAAFAVTAPITGVWHYGFVVVFIALALVVAAELLLRRRPLRAWLAVGLAHLPYVATMGFLYVAHVSRMSDYLVGFHRGHYASWLSLGAADVVEPFLGVWRYLELSPFAEIFLGLSALGAFCLLVNGERIALLVCVVPLAVAYGFSWSGLIPLGGTRHSAYLFPFLFGLVASQVPEILTGYRRAVTNLRGVLARRSSGRVASRQASVPLAAPLLGFAAIAVFGVAFAGASLLDHGAEKNYDPLDGLAARNELPTWYRSEDVERAFALLEARVVEDDLVVLEFQGLYAMRMHYRTTPPAKRRPRWARRRDPVRKYTHHGVTYYYTHVSSITTPESLVKVVERVLATRRLADPERVWTVQGAWETPLAGQLTQRYPGVPFDADVVRETNGLVLAIDWQDLRKVAKRGRSEGKKTRAP